MYFTDFDYIVCLYLDCSAIGEREREFVQGDKFFFQNDFSLSTLVACEPLQVEYKLMQFTMFLTCLLISNATAFLYVLLSSIYTIHL
jgi:hypothetical protein